MGIDTTLPDSTAQSEGVSAAHIQRPRNRFTECTVLSMVLSLLDITSFLSNAAGSRQIVWCHQLVGVWPCLPLQPQLSCQDDTAGPQRECEAGLEPTQGVSK